MPRLTQATFAQHVGLERPAVNELVGRKILDLSLGLDQARIQYCKHLRKRAAGHISADGQYDLVAERARLSFHQANVESLKEAQLRGDLLPSDMVRETWAQMIGALRARLIALPTKTAHAAIAASSLQEIEEAIRVQVFQALAELSSDGTQTPDYADSIGDAGQVGPTTEADRQPVG